MCGRSLCCAALALLLHALHPAIGRAQTAAPPRAVEAIEPAPAAKDPVSGLPLQGLMRLLDAHMRGQRVIAVAPDSLFNDRELDATEYGQARTMIEKLQVISASQSAELKEDATGLNQLIPFKVGGSYAIAPEMREGVNVDLDGLSPLDATARGTLLLSAIFRLDPKQFPALGSEAGLPVSALPREAREMVVRAFRPPLKILDQTSSTVTDNNGFERPSISVENAGIISELPDWSRARIRANLRLMGASTRSETGGAFIQNERQEGMVFETVDATHASWRDQGTDLPIFRIEPNTYKPSDLEGRRLTQPFGLSGVWKTGDVVARMSRVTGLKMRVWKVYEERPVFIGTPAVTVGEVLDALRLGLTASWRKLGDTYLLSFDKMPIQAIQQTAREASKAVTKQVRVRQARLSGDPAWIPMITTLPFAPDDPMALTPEQRTRLFLAKPEPGPEGRPADTSIPFTDLTPDQQSFLRAQAQRSAAYVPPTAPGQPATQRPFTQEDIMGASLMPQGSIVVSMQVPGVGWVRAPEEWDGLSFNVWQLRNAIRKAGGDAETRDILDDAPPEVRQMLDNMKPMPLLSPVRGAVVPAFGPARLNELAASMKRHGLNTLFYPVLYGGYATFASKAFPLHPSLRGEDGWAAAVAAMKPKGIQVVGYLNTLAWQNAGDKVHWLDKYPQWLDVDVLGRPRLTWAASNPEAKDRSAVFGISTSNYVRPNEPMVERKLQALVAEFAQKRDAAGIAFAEWNVGHLPEMLPGGGSLPSLGFALPDRLAALNRTGQDPADAFDNDDYLPGSLRRSWEWRGADDKPPMDHHQALVTRLLADAKERRKDWTTCLVNNTIEPDRRPMAAKASGTPDTTPKADVTINSMFSVMKGNSAMGGGIMFPIATRNFFSVMADAEEIAEFETIPQKLRDLPSIAVFNLIFATEERMKTRRYPLAVLDFRGAPETISETLKWIAASNVSATPQKPAPRIVK